MHSSKARKPDFRKSSYSAGNGACLEVGEETSDGGIAVRDSKNLGMGPILHYSTKSWRSFICDLKEQI